MRLPHGIAEIRRAYGDIEVRDGAVVAPPGWEAKHMLVVSDLPGWKGRKLYLHRAMEMPLRAALGGAIATGWLPTSLGCFAPRLKRNGSGLLSLHSWGCAIDVDAQTNPMLLDCPIGDPRRRHALPVPVIAAFKSAGFFWGGDWPTLFDPMHFQLATGY